MRISSIIVAFLTSVGAKAVPTMHHRRQEFNGGAFSVIASRTGSPIHLLPMTASGTAFWLGGRTSSYCPPMVEPQCPPGNETVIMGQSFLDVAVPGGQQIYVDPNGALSFTVAHSAFIPPGSSLGPFIYTPGTPFGTWTFTGRNASGFMACPVSNINPTATSPNGAQYQVFAALMNATVPSGNVRDCIGFRALAVPWNQSAAAWQYT